LTDTGRKIRYDKEVDRNCKAGLAVWLSEIATFYGAEKGLNVFQNGV